MVGLVRVSGDGSVFVCSLCYATVSLSTDQRKFSFFSKIKTISEKKEDFRLLTARL